MAKKKRRLVKGGRNTEESDNDNEEENVNPNRMVSRGPRFLSETIENDEEGEDLIESAENDYRHLEELDNYEDDMLASDQSDIEELDLGGRMAVDTMLNERDRLGTDRVPTALADDLDSLWSSVADDDEFDGSIDPEKRRMERRKRALADKRVVLQDFGVPLNEWLDKEHVQEEVKIIFKELLLNYTEDENSNDGVYINRISKMCSKGKFSLQVDYSHIADTEPVLALWLGECAVKVTTLLNQAALSAVLELFPAYNVVHPEIIVRIRKWPIIETVRELRSFHLGALLKVEGVVTRRTAPLFKLRSILYRCSNGCQEFGPFDFDKRPKLLPECDMCENGRTILVPEKSIFYRHQRLLLQEAPGSVPPGRVPRYKEVLVEADLVDRCRPGEQIQVTGVLNLKAARQMMRKENRKFQFPVFSTFITANNVDLIRENNLSNDVSDRLQDQFRKFAKSPFAFDTLIRSIAPSVFGCTVTKRAIALSLFGGQRKQVGSHTMRGDIHVLLVGDPGVAKSQCLKYAEKCVRRGVYTTGKGASAVGLTAAVHKDPVSKEWVLEGGALVLADRGVCVIDEFDKMNDRDRTAIHEAMEQQTISISKAGIVTTLKARCSVLAAANPVLGRYDLQRSFVENVVLTDPIIQRFDVLCVLKDVVNVERDKKLAKFVLASHISSHPDANKVNENDMEIEGNKNLYSDMLQNIQFDTQVQTLLKDKFPEILDENGLFTQEMLRKYIEYSKTFRPRFQNTDNDKVSRVYVELRRQSMKHGGIPISVRHLESIIRLSEARSRMLLKKRVEVEDINTAIGVILHSFISAQKASVQGHLRRVFEKYLSNTKEEEQILLYLISEMCKDSTLEEKTICKLSELEARATTMNFQSLHKFIRSKTFLEKYEVDYKKGLVKLK